MFGHCIREKLATRLLTRKQELVGNFSKWTVHVSDIRGNAKICVHTLLTGEAQLTGSDELNRQLFLL